MGDSSLNNVPVLGTILQLYEEGKSTRDPRVKDWLLLQDNPVYVWILTVMYLVTVHVGMKVMKNRQPFHLQKFMVVYNFALVILSAYMLFEILLSCIDLGYFDEDPLCCPYNSRTKENPKELRLAKVLWWYFFSKALEFMDTFLMVLRKKNNQVSFLHLFHHVSMLNFWWWVMTYIPGGQAWFASSLNSSVHIVMYSYYALSAIPSMRGKLWWKKYLTKFQLVQFVLTLFHTLNTTFSGCDFPLWSQHLLASYMVILLVLFGNFYIQAYRKQTASTYKKTDRHIANGNKVSTQNGVSVAEKTANGHASNGITNGYSHS